MIIKKDMPTTIAASVAHGSPDNWPTVWQSPDGKMQHRLKTNEMLQDYLMNQDLLHLGDT